MADERQKKERVKHERLHNTCTVKLEFLCLSSVSQEKQKAVGLNLAGHLCNCCLQVCLCSQKLL